MVLIEMQKDLPLTFGASAKRFNAHRSDFVIDQYPDISIKNLERSKEQNQVNPNKDMYQK